MKKLLIVLSLVFINGFAYGNACDRDCSRQGPKVPCGTWKKPLRTCPSYYTDPICLSDRMLCNQTFAACVTAALITYNATPFCIALLYETGVNPVSVEVCLISAETLQIVYDNCR